MASPAIATTATTNITTSADPWTVNLPASIANGDLVVLHLRTGGGAAALNVPSGWTSLVTDNASDASDDKTSILYRVCDGTEGTTLSVDWTGTAKGSAIAYRITGHDAGTAPTLSTVAVGTDATAEPGAAVLDQSRDWLILAFTGLDGETQTITTWPTNYTLNQLEANSGTAGAATINNRTAAAGRQVTTASETPGAFTWSASPSTGWTAYTVAIAPTAGGAAGSLLGPRTWSKILAQR